MITCLIFLIYFKVSRAEQGFEEQEKRSERRSLRQISLQFQFAELEQEVRFK